MRDIVPGASGGSAGRDCAVGAAVVCRVRVLVGWSRPQPDYGRNPRGD
ncbi:hypothetical protein [Streptomyces sp. NPDC005890]